MAANKQAISDQETDGDQGENIDLESTSRQDPGPSMVTHDSDLQPPPGIRHVSDAYDPGDWQEESPGESRGSIPVNSSPVMVPIENDTENDTAGMENDTAGMENDTAEQSELMLPTSSVQPEGPLVNTDFVVIETVSGKPEINDRKKIEELNKKVKEQQEEITKLKEELRGYYRSRQVLTEVDKLIGCLDELMKESRQLESALKQSTLTILPGDIYQELSLLLERLKTQKLEEKNRNLHQENAELRRHAGYMQPRLEEESTTVEDLQSENADLERENADLKSENADLKRENEVMKGELDYMRYRLEKEFNNYEAMMGEKADMTAQLCSLTETYLSIANELERVKNELERVKNELERFRQRDQQLPEHQQ